MRRQAMFAFVAIAVYGLAGWLSPVDGQESPGVLNDKLKALRTRESDCLQRAASITQQRREATYKPYTSDESRLADWSRLDTALQDQRQCLTKTGETLVWSLAGLEIECQKALESRRPGVAAELDDSARCVEGARRERLIRERLAGFRAEQFACDQEASSINRFTQKEVASPSYTKGTSRTYRDQESDIRMFDKARAEKQACGTNAAVQIAILQRALGLSSSGSAGQVASTLEADTRGLIDAIRKAAQQVQSGQYDGFKGAADALRSRLSAYRVKYQQVVAPNASQVARVVEAGDALLGVADAWRLEMVAARETAILQAEIGRGSERGASASDRARLSDNRSALQSVVAGQAEASRKRADAWGKSQQLIAAFPEGDPGQAAQR